MLATKGQSTTEPVQKLAHTIATASAAENGKNVTISTDMTTAETAIAP
jgi:hypothetical protein